MRHLILILVLILAGCSTNQPSNNAAKNGNSAVKTNNNAANSEPFEPQAVEAVLNMEKDFKPSYKIAEIQDVSFGSVKRFVVSVTLPPNLPKEDVEQNFKYAILQICKDKNARAVTIWGFREGEDVKQLYTVGSAVFAPEGVWEKADENNKNLQNYKVAIELKDSYFNPRKPLSVGDVVTLNGHKTDEKNTGTTRIWNDEAKRLDSNVLLEVPNGTKAKILEKKQTGAGGFIPFVYKVEVDQRTGWVDSIDVSEN